MFTYSNAFKRDALYMFCCHSIHTTFFIQSINQSNVLFFFPSKKKQKNKNKTKTAIILYISISIRYT